MADNRAREDHPDGRPDSDAGSRVRYGGGHQEGGGIVEPDEFADGGTDVLDDEPDHGSAQATANDPTKGADPPR